jgi:ketosteroid isomerase-like protein
MTFDMIAFQEDLMKTIAGVFILLAGAAVLWGADPETPIRDAEKAWANAVMARDFQALEKIFGDKLIYAHSTGAIESKEQYLGRLRSGAQKYDTIVHESIHIVPYGDSAVSHSILRMTGTSNGKPFNDHVMALHIWEKQGGSWRLAAHQTTKLAE